MNKQIMSVLNEIKRLADLSPKYRLSIAAYEKRLKEQGYKENGVVSSRPPWLKNVGVRISTYKISMGWRMPMAEFESILEKLSEEGFIDFSEFVADDIGGYDSYFQIGLSENFENKYEAALTPSQRGEIPPGPTAANERTQALLSKTDPDLERRYLQVMSDLEGPPRLSYAGTANELREIITKLLHQMAPTEEVTTKDWYKQAVASDSNHPPAPTRAERLRFIMEAKGNGGASENASSAENLMEKSMAKVVTSSYARLSSAAHGDEQKEELKRCLGYFDAFIGDILT